MTRRFFLLCRAEADADEAETAIGTVATDFGTDTVELACAFLAFLSARLSAVLDPALNMSGGFRGRLTRLSAGEDFAILVGAGLLRGEDTLLA